MTDRDLLEAYAKSRDPECFGVFMARHEGPLLRFVSAYLGDGHAAEDIVQETFLRVARNPRKPARTDNCRNWLLAVARNLSVDHLRRNHRTQKRVEKLRAEGGGREVEAPEAEVEREELRARVREAIARLPPRLRELVVLKVQEGRSYREIAEITGLTVTNVGYLLHRAMKELAWRLSSLKDSIT